MSEKVFEQGKNYYYNLIEPFDGHFKEDSKSKDEIDKLEKTKLNVKEFSKREEAYATFALIAFFCILLEILLRNTVLKKIP